MAAASKATQSGLNDVPRPQGAGRRFLIFNFFEGVLLRGIPTYVQNLCIALKEEGIETRVVRCPAAFRRLPRSCLNLLFVIYEQLLVPFRSLAYDRVICPYNSAPFLGSLMGNSLLVVHDFISNSRRNHKFSARYIRVTQRVHACFGRDVAYVSRSTERVGRAVGLFSRSQTFFFPNSFFLFARALPPALPSRGEHVLLCTGWGKNKDLPGALEMFRQSELYRKRSLRILGIANHQEAVDVFCAKYPELAEHITVLPRLDDAEVAQQYRAAAWVWVHSGQEGYGRSIAEAKLCGCRIVASDLPSFREQRGKSTFLYSGMERFLDAWAQCEAAKPESPAEQPREHAILLREIETFLAVNHLNTGQAK